jgi:hypothetical protein
VRVLSRVSGLGAGASVQSDLGDTFVLDQALVTTVAVEILPCQSALRSLWDVAVPNARAHGVSSPTRLATPRVEDALANEELELGELTPPAGRYCSLSIELGPADDDAEGLDDAPDALGRSLRLRGSAAGEPFAVESTLAVESTRSVEVTLDESHRDVTLAVEHDIARWFDGVALATPSDADLERRVLENLERSIAVHVE